MYIYGRREYLVYIQKRGLSKHTRFIRFLRRNYPVNHDVSEESWINTVIEYGSTKEVRITLTPEIRFYTVKEEMILYGLRT